MKKSLLVLLLASASAAAAATDDSPLNGKWQVRMRIGTYESVQVCRLAVTGTELSVRCSGGMGAGEFSGKARGRKFSWSRATPMGPNFSSQSYENELISPTKFEGSLTMMPLGNGGDITGTRCLASDDDKACLAMK